MSELMKSKGRRPRTGVVKTCPQCGIEFYVSPANAAKLVCCSRDCKDARQRRQVQIVCATCGETFEKATSRFARFCTRKCYEKSRKPRKVCAVCGAELPLSARTYCSEACTKIGRKTGADYPCEMCGKTFYRPRASAKRYCSRKCKDAGLRIAGPGVRVKRQDGYIAVYYPTHPDAVRGGTILEHRLVAEQKYGRRILKSEHVHHLNGIRDDNRPENLEIISPTDHQKISSKQGVDKRRTIREEIEEYRRRFGPLT